MAHSKGSSLDDNPDRDDDRTSDDEKGGSGGGGASRPALDFASELAASQNALLEALRSLAAGPEITRQIAASQNALLESVRRIATGPEIARQIAESQNALLESVRKSVTAPQAVRQIAESQDALLKSVRQLSVLPSGTIWPTLSQSAPLSYRERARTALDRAPEPSPAKGVPELSLLQTHASEGWRRTPEAERLQTRIRRRQQVRVLVLAADIRKSSLAMNEALDPYEYASTMGDFVEAARSHVFQNAGLFDKFTGDGFISVLAIRQPDAPPSDQSDDGSGEGVLR